MKMSSRTEMPLSPFKVFDTIKRDTPLELAIRRGTADAWTVRRAKKPDLPAEVVRRDASETVLRLPPLGAFEPALVGPGGARR